MNKRINQKALQTGNPRGTYKQGHPHPTVDGVVYFGWRPRDNKEEWITRERLEARQSTSRKWKKSWLEANADKYKAIKKAWREANIERARAATKVWAEANPGAVSEGSSKSRAKNLGQAPKLTKDERAMCVGFYDQMQRLNAIFGKNKFNVDHTIPLELGGLHHPSNLQVVPAKWNACKKSRHSERWQLPYGQ